MMPVFERSSKQMPIPAWYSGSVSLVIADASRDETLASPPLSPPLVAAAALSLRRAQPMEGQYSGERERERGGGEEEGWKEDDSTFQKEAIAQHWFYQGRKGRQGDGRSGRMCVRALCVYVYVCVCVRERERRERVLGAN